MSELIEFSLNRATEAEIANHLWCCDADFIPPLHGRVNISDYAHKIVSKAIRFEAWAGGDVVGLVAIYCNDNEHQTTYITSVSVLHKWQGSGIASQLIAQSIRHANKLGFWRIELEVDRSNVGAIKLYEKKGFIMNKVNDRTGTMYLNIGKDI